MSVIKKMWKGCNSVESKANHNVTINGEQKEI